VSRHIRKQQLGVFYRRCFNDRHRYHARRSFGSRLSVCTALRSRLNNSNSRCVDWHSRALVAYVIFHCAALGLILTKLRRVTEGNNAEKQRGATKFLDAPPTTAALSSAAGFSACCYWADTGKSFCDSRKSTIIR